MPAPKPPTVSHPEPFGPEQFAEAAGVSRETLARLKAYAGLLQEWNARHNLVAASTLPDLWHRHFWDSAQLAAFIPAEVAHLVDLGAGAGFPGLVLAIMLRERPGFQAVLYESVAKKCRFLQTVAERVDAPVEVRNERIEQAKPEIFEVVTARACAPLTRLLSYAQAFQGPATINLFLKGQSVEDELTDAHKSWTMNVQRHVSRTDKAGTVLEIRGLTPRR